MFPYKFDFVFFGVGKNLSKCLNIKKLKKEILAINPLYIIKFKMVYQNKIVE